MVSSFSRLQTKKVFKKSRVNYPIESSHLNLQFYTEDEMGALWDDTVDHKSSSFDTVGGKGNTGKLMQRLEIKTEFSSYAYISLGYFGLTKIVTMIGGFNAATISLFNLCFGSLFSAMFLSKIGEKLAKSRKK